jgi:hypothetical protein
LAKSARNKKRRKQKGVEAIFSPTEESQNSLKPTPIADGKTDRITRPVRLFVQLQASLILFLLLWLIYAPANDLNFKNRFYETLSYFPPVQLLAIGVTGLGLSIAWGIVNYRTDHRKLNDPVRESPEGDLRVSLETDSYPFALSGA